VYLTPFTCLLLDPFYLIGLGISIFPLWAVTSALETGTLVARPISKKGVPLTWRALFMKGNNTPIYQKEIIRMMQRTNIISQD